VTDPNAAKMAVEGSGTAAGCTIFTVRESAFSSVPQAQVYDVPGVNPRLAKLAPEKKVLSDMLSMGPLPEPCGTTSS
jgi:hypothetical protein